MNKETKAPTRFRLLKTVLVVVLVLVAAGLLLRLFPVRHKGPSALGQATASMLENLRTAIDMYFLDEGDYPSDVVTTDVDGLDKPSETLYFYLSGQEVSSPDPGKRKALREQRMGRTVYMDFHVNSLADFDSDGNYEIVDYFGNPWIYVRRPSAEEQKAAKMGDPDNGYRPWHRKMSYDLFSVGADGKTGTKWTLHSRMFEWEPSDENSFYRQATDEPEDGDKDAAGYSADDIANF